jgi:hypothetical protein
MATIAEQLTSLANTKTAIKDAIVAKGVTVADTDPFSGYAAKIGQISGGGAPATKFGTSIDNLIGDVDTEGNYIKPTEEFVLDLTGVKHVPSTGFDYTFYIVKSITGVIADDVISVGQYGFRYAFYGSNVKNASFGSLELVDASDAFYNTFYNTPIENSPFPRLKKICAPNALNSAFNAASKLSEYDKALPALEEVSGAAALGNCIYPFVGEKKLILSRVKKITGDKYSYSAVFGSLYTDNTKWYFPRATEFIGYVWGGSSKGEIHFAAANQAAIEACDGYDMKWGFAGATIYFDLMLSITVNGVVYAREYTIGGYTSWEDTDGNIVYTDATSEPAVGTVVYSDQGVTEFGTVSEVA